ncbi:amidase [Tianweitania sediminis]|uniref:Amidase n=1 Tax=Tianweitania sediminis TaxID=1502156 RepID=A0A8J7R1N3_9HYPH|nr:amidase [Tianweitania sediminis]MBP0441143.1 amidase [Tianweitania sediminis]
MTDIADRDASSLSAALATGDLSCVEVMAAFLDRIGGRNPAINAIVSLRQREDLLNEAAAADAALALGQSKGWLHGIPIAVKDLVDTAGLRSTHGSPIFADHVPKKDDLLAARLRAAGAIFIGKTNTPEWGLGSHSYNPVHGVTRNPYDHTRSAGGSSGGAAAALAARLVPVADGSDMMGSLRNPAAFCNVYGMRPSYGRVPADADGETFLHQLSTDGPMARSVSDLARLLDTLAGHNPEHPHSLPKAEAFAPHLSAKIKGRKIAWLGDWSGAYPIEPGILPLCEEALRVFDDMGAEVEPVSAPFPADALWQSWTVLRSFAVSGSLRAHWDNPAQRELLKPEAIYEIERGQRLTAQEIQAASALRSQWFAAAARVFDRFDALVLPSAQVFPFPAEWTWPRAINNQAMDSYHRWMEVVVPASLVGLPALNVPAGFSPTGLPMGMQLIGRRGNDLRLLQLGQAYHEATNWPERRPPVFDGQ